MSYVPDRGDIIWINFDPQAGHEQASHRPALVLTPKAYNRKTSLCVVCPLTTRIKGYPFEVPLGTEGKSVVLADQIKSLDWKARKARRKGSVDHKVLNQVCALISALIL